MEAVSFHAQGAPASLWSGVSRASRPGDYPTSFPWRPRIWTVRALRRVVRLHALATEKAGTAHRPNTGHDGQHRQIGVVRDGTCRKVSRAVTEVTAAAVIGHAQAARPRNAGVVTGRPLVAVSAHGALRLEYLRTGLPVRGLMRCCGAGCSSGGMTCSGSAGSCAGAGVAAPNPSMVPTRRPFS
jgi:hypothetical protein